MNALTRLRGYTSGWFTAKNFAVIAALIAIGGVVALAIDRTGVTELAEKAGFPDNADSSDERDPATTAPPAASSGETPPAGAPIDPFAPTAIPVTTTAFFPAVATPVPLERSQAISPSVDTPRATSEVIQAAERAVRDTASGLSGNVSSATIAPSTTVTAAPASTAAPTTSVNRPSDFASPSTTANGTPPSTTTPSATIRNHYTALEFGASLDEVRTLFNATGSRLALPGNSSTTAYVWSGNGGRLIVTVFSGNGLVAKSQFNL